MRLTPRQQQIYDLIRDTIRESGYPPTRAEIASTLGFRSANAAEAHLRALAKKGVIDIIPNTSRGIRLCEAAPEGLPLVGRVAAGQPILAEQHIEDYCAVAPELFHPTADYLLTVQGDSMRDAGIQDGDLLAVHSTTQARNGQLVVARIGDQVTVKTFRTTRQRHIVQLLPSNPDYSPIQVDLREEAFVIEGLGVGVIRTRV